MSRGLGRTEQRILDQLSMRARSCSFGLTQFQLEWYADGRPVDYTGAPVTSRGSWRDLLFYDRVESPSRSLRESVRNSVRRLVAKGLIEKKRRYGTLYLRLPATEEVRAKEAAAEQAESVAAMKLWGSR